jgi:hypothetical protein
MRHFGDRFRTDDVGDDDGCSPATSSRSPSHEADESRPATEAPPSSGRPRHPLDAEDGDL